MAFGHGKDAKFKLGTAGTPGTPVDLSDYVRSVGFPRTVDTAETSTFQKASKTYIVGMADGTISLEGVWDPTLDAQLAGLVRVQDVSFEYYPQGDAAGKVKYSGVCVMTSYEAPADIGDAVTFSAELQISGDVSRATV